MPQTSMSTAAQKPQREIQSGVIPRLNSSLSGSSRQNQTQMMTIAPKAAIPIHYGTVVGKESDFDTFAKGLGFAVKKLFL